MHALHPYYGFSCEYFLQMILVRKLQSDKMLLKKMEDLYPYLALVYWWTGLDLLAKINTCIYSYINI